MDFLIIGDGPEEWAWATAIAEHDGHHLRAACPGFKALPDLPGGLDLDGALAIAGIEAVVVGGESDLRAEALRRAAAQGLPAICLHPPGPNADPYYQVALSRQETGAIVVPDLPARLHPGVEALRTARADGSLGPIRSLRYEAPVGPHDGVLTAEAFPRVVDVVRSLLGEVESITATGDPAGPRPSRSLLVQLRGPKGRPAEVRLWVGAPEPARLILAGAEGSLTLEHDAAYLGASRLIRRSTDGAEEVVEIPPWDAKGAILRSLSDAVAGIPSRPDLLDGTRAVELAEAAARSLRRGRTVDLHYEEVSEAGNFKTVMTSTGCMLLVAILVVLPLALAGPALGMNWTLYLAWALPPLLALFILLQLLRFGIKPPPPPATRAGEVPSP